MGIPSDARVALAAKLGFVRVVLDRELTLTDLGRLQAQLQQRQPGQVCPGLPVPY